MDQFLLIYLQYQLRLVVHQVLYVRAPPLALSRMLVLQERLLPPHAGTP